MSTNVFDAKQEILRVLFVHDLRASQYRFARYGYHFVYYCAETAKFSFEPSQRKRSTLMITRFTASPNMDEIVRITATKYTFAQIAIGAVVSRKIMSREEFFKIAKEHFEWL